MISDNEKEKIQRLTQQLNNVITGKNIKDVKEICREINLPILDLDVDGDFISIKIPQLIYRTDRYINSYYRQSTYVTGWDEEQLRDWLKGLKKRTELQSRSSIYDRSREEVDISQWTEDMLENLSDQQVFSADVYSDNIVLSEYDSEGNKIIKEVKIKTNDYWHS